MLSPDMKKPSGVGAPEGQVPKGKAMSETERTTPAPKSATPDSLTLSDDAIRVARPGWMPRATWADIKAAAATHTDELVEAALARERVRRAVAESPASGCTERSWCVLGQSQEHLQYHAGGHIDLTDSVVPEGEEASGWWGWLTEDRGPAGEPRLTVEAVITQPDVGRETYSSEVDAVQAQDLLRATAAPEAHARLLELVTTALGES